MKQKKKGVLMQISAKELSDLIPNSNNRVDGVIKQVTQRRVRQIKENMVQFGYKRGLPVIINDELIICDGHHRVQAAIELDIPAWVLIDPDAKIKMPFPFKDLIGPQAFFTTCYAPLFDAFPDLERRDWIVIGGETEEGNHWVGCGGHYSGTFVAPWLDIPATGHLAHMRFHEFFRFEILVLALSRPRSFWHWSIDLL